MKLELTNVVKYPTNVCTYIILGKDKINQFVMIQISLSCFKRHFFQSRLFFKIFGTYSRLNHKQMHLCYQRNIASIFEL